MVSIHITDNSINYPSMRYCLHMRTNTTSGIDGSNICNVHISRLQLCVIPNFRRLCNFFTSLVDVLTPQMLSLRHENLLLDSLNII